MRLIEKLDFAKVYRDVEWQEYRVKFYDVENNHLVEADYFTDDKEDAILTAKNWKGV